MNNKQIIIGAAIFYVVIAPFFFHPDLKIIYQLSSFLSQGVFNIYEHYAQNPALFHLGPFVYPPAAYFIVGIIYPIVRLFGGFGFPEWLNMGNNAVDTFSIYRYLLAIKLPLIAVHLYSGWLLFKKPQGLVLWLFNPVSIYVVAVMGQIDGLAVLCVILAMHFAHKRPLLGSVSLGLGAAIKAFPLLLIPVYCLLVGRNWKERVVMGLVGGGIYGIFILPFLSTPAFWEHTLTSGLSQRLLAWGVLGIPVVPVILIAIYLTALIKDLGNIGKLNIYFLAIGCLVLASVHFHPQWALWVLPMVCTLIIQTRMWLWGFVFAFGWIASIFSFNDRFLTWGLFSPLEKAILYLPSPVSQVSETVANLVSWSGQAAVIIFGLWVLYLIFSKRNEVS
jgi:hypothetical protein